MHRRTFLQSALGLGGCLALPLWARPARAGNAGKPTEIANRFDLRVERFPVMVNGRKTFATGVNRSMPGPLLRFREGEAVEINVTNALPVDTSIHWHGLLVPFEMDGVPGVTFPGIKPGETFQYRFAVPQNGTYWYHSHSGLQEQVGHHGPLVIDPAGADPHSCNREYVLMLADWTYLDPHRLFTMLKTNGAALNRQMRTTGDFMHEVEKQGLHSAMETQGMWARMRMNQRDILDVGGSVYTYLINGHASDDNFNMLYHPGERVRLRIINGSAMTIFNVRMPDLPMIVVQNDGQNVVPVETDELQIGVAETYDVIVTPKGPGPHAFVAEAMDRSGQVVATLGTSPDQRAPIPALRPVPDLTMADMGMMHMGHGMDMGNKDHDMAGMDHGQMHMGPDPHGPSEQIPKQEAKIEMGPGVANVNAAPRSRLDEPGTGLEDVGHRVLCYAELQSDRRNTDTRAPGRELVIHLTSNMERYMWSFDGVKFSEVTDAIHFTHGERLRLTLINDTMMSHPIHLHGMFFELDNGHGDFNPRKHTVIVKPAERLSVNISADHVGDWAFHCHLLYHMHAGMMQVVSIRPVPDAPQMPGRVRT